MAIKSVVISDMGGKELDESQAARVTVSGHPALDGRSVVLDVSGDEAGKLKDTELYLVHLNIQEPGKPLREVTMEVDDFHKLFPAKLDVSQLLTNARISSDAPTRGRRRRSSSNGSGPKADYTSPEHAGQLHRGRVTEAEAEWVRNNLEAANANRAKAGQAPIDPSDAKEKQRYGL